MLHFAHRYGVRSQPTLMLFKNSSVKVLQVGAPSKSQLKAFIEPNLVKGVLPPGG